MKTFLTVLLTTLLLQSAPIPKEVVEKSKQEIINKTYVVEWSGYTYIYQFNCNGSYKWKNAQDKEWRYGSYIWNSEKRVLLLWEEDFSWCYKCRFYILDLFDGGLTGKIRFSEYLGFYSPNNCTITFKGD